MERRRQVKNWLKQTLDPLKHQQLDIQQQALKLTANRYLDFICSNVETHTISVYHTVFSKHYFLSEACNKKRLTNLMVWQYVWVPGFCQFKILCETACRTDHFTGYNFTEQFQDFMMSCESNFEYI